VDDDDAPPDAAPRAPRSTSPAEQALPISAAKIAMISFRIPAIGRPRVIF
jgi:hypothetical protein